MTTSIVSAKGWVVIPKAIRDRYSIKKGDKVHFIDYGGTIYVFKALKDPIHDARGMFKDGPSLTQALLEERRKEFEKEERDIERWGGRRSQSE